MRLAGYMLVTLISALKALLGMYGMLASSSLSSTFSFISSSRIDFFGFKRRGYSSAISSITIDTILVRFYIKLLEFIFQLKY